MLFYLMQVVIININNLPLHYLSKRINYLMFENVVLHYLTGNKTLSINNYIDDSQLDS